MMATNFSKFLFQRSVREKEVEEIRKFIPGEQSRILEIGGGKGCQAAYLTKLGFDISSIDIEEKPRWSSEDRVFPIITYDGKNIPFPDNSFDFIFSSQVLEHIEDLDSVHSEMKRVLKEGGEMAHLVPSGSWAFWRCVLSPASRFQMIFRRVMGEDRKKHWFGIRPLLKFLMFPLPRRHGDNRKTFFGALGEIWIFSFYSWTWHLQQQNYIILESRPLGLFYTTYCFMGLRLSWKTRESLSKFFGSTVFLFRIKPKDDKTEVAK